MIQEKYNKRIFRQTMRPTKIAIRRNSAASPLRRRLPRRRTRLLWSTRKPSTSIFSIFRKIIIYFEKSRQFQIRFRQWRWRRRGGRIWIRRVEGRRGIWLVFGHFYLFLFWWYVQKNSESILNHPFKCFLEYLPSLTITKFESSCTLEWNNADENEMVEISEKLFLKITCFFL